MAPTKLSVQTYLILDEMDINGALDDEHWEHLQQSLDLLFAKVSAINTNQVGMKAQLDLNSQVADQTVRDQLTLSQQIAETGRAVAQLRLDRSKEPAYDEEGSPKSKISKQGKNFFTHNEHSTVDHEVGNQQHSFRHRGGGHSSGPQGTTLQFLKCFFQNLMGLIQGYGLIKQSITSQSTTFPSFSGDCIHCCL